MSIIEDYSSKDFFNYVEKYVDDKLKQNENYLRYSYYELKVRENLSDEGIERFLKCSRSILEGMNYNVYFTGDKFEYDRANRVVEFNELLIACRNK